MKTTNAMPTHDEISAQARQRWEQAGQPVGRDEEFWLQAERELRRRGEANAAPTVPGREANGRSKGPAARRPASTAAAGAR
jgi:hypothetical protein